MHAFRRAKPAPEAAVHPLRRLLESDAELAAGMRGVAVVLVSGPVPVDDAPWAGAGSPVVISVVGREEDRHSPPARQEALRLDLELDRLGQVDVIVDDSGAGLTRLLRRWERLFLHLRPGGAYVLGDPDPSSVIVESIRTVFPEAPGAELTAASRSLRGAKNADGYTVATAGSGHVLKIRDTIDGAMSAWAPGLQVTQLARIPGGTDQGTGAQVVSHGQSSAVTLPSLPVTYPDLVLRRFRGTVEVRNNLLTVSGNAVLPPSFHHPAVPASRNKDLRTINERFGTLVPAEDPPVLEGSFFDFGCAEPGHFGHVLTESVAKLWGLEAALAAAPDLRVLVRTPSDDYSPDVERLLLDAVGVDEDRIEWVSTDVAVTSLISASPAWQNAPPYYFHPVIRETWSRLGSGRMSTAGSGPARIFLSRRFSDVNRRCRNVDEVETFFLDRGYAIVQPEQLPFEEQAELVANAEVIAGFGGSAMFNVLFAQRAKRLVVLLHESYTARNEWLYAQALGLELHYFWSKADIPQPQGRYAEQAFHSSWSFDLAEHAAELEAVI
jgi:capsular polysaccharide biosynthesis protein